MMVMQVRKKMEHNLKKSEQKLQESFKLAGDWVVFKYLIISIFQPKRAERIAQKVLDGCMLIHAIKNTK